MYLLGYDVGSSSIKASLIEIETGVLAGSAFSPETEMVISSPKPGWAEQDPEMWWKNLIRATKKMMKEQSIDVRAIKGIGISYQMHGLVVVDKHQQVLRPSIIWCDGRAVETGRKALKDLGEDTCLKHFLNSPGNFTVSKLKWVMENEPDLYKNVYKFMLPGDYIAMKMSGEIVTSLSGLSEGILWDFIENDTAHILLNYYGIDQKLVPEKQLNFSEQGTLTSSAANELGLVPGIPITYRAGDQPNNALSLNVLDPGEIASTAGTSGVIYGIADSPIYDKQSRVNTFIHVNHKDDHPRYGILLCINGTGIQYSWLKNKLLGNGKIDYPVMNDLSAKAPIGSDGLIILPFGNGPERSLGDRDIGAKMVGINFNRHEPGHVIRAAQEGIAFALNYGLQIMKNMNINVDVIRAAKANMFLSPVFTEAITNTTGAIVELYETDGSRGAAIGAGIGAGIYKGREEAFRGLKKLERIEPDKKLSTQYEEAYARWQEVLEKC